MEKMSESQVKANPTKATFDAEEHAQDLMNQRKKRADSTIEVTNSANAKRKNATDDGDKQQYSVDDEYSIEEPREQVNGELDGEDNSGEPKSPLQ